MLYFHALVSIEPTSIVGRIVDNNRLRCVLTPDVGVCVHSYLRPPPAPGAGCRGSAGRAGPQRKPSALRQQRSPPRPSPQSRCSDLQIKTEGRVTCYSVSATVRCSFHQETSSARAERLDNTHSNTALLELFLSVCRHVADFL